MSSTPEVEAPIRRRTFGDGLAFTELTLGLFGPSTGAYGEVSHEGRAALVERAFELGVRCFDVAPLWGDSETLVAEVLGARVNDVAIVTRAGRRLVDGALDVGFSLDALRQDLEASLRRVGRSQVDVVLLHAPMPIAFRRRGEALDALRVLKEEGLVRAVGASVGSAAQAQAALDAGTEVLAMPLNLLAADEFESIRGEFAHRKIGFFATSPLLHGLLADKLTFSHAFGPEDHRSLRWTRESLRVRLRHVAALRYLVGQDTLPSMAVASLRYVLAQPEVTSVCLGPRTVEQLDELVRNAGAPPYLSETALARLPQILAAAGA